MKRGLTEWLLAPLFLLPAVAGAWFALYARNAYLDEVRPYRTDGERRARQWLEDEPETAAWLVRRFTRDHAPGTAGTLPAGAGVPFTVDGFPAVLERSAPEGRGEAWTFVTESPVGLTPDALGDEKVRLAVETGTPPAATGRVDPATAAFARLLAAPDVDGLRRAPLPAETKEYLLDRWRRAGRSPPFAADATAVVSAVRAFTAATDGRPGELGPGEHRMKQR